MPHQPPKDDLQYREIDLHSTPKALLKIISGTDVVGGSMTIPTMDGFQDEVPKWYEFLFGGLPTRRMLGYNSVGDGGGGLFYWNANKPKILHNGGTIIDPSWNGQGNFGNPENQKWFSSNNSGTGVWIKNKTTKINIEDFGGAINDIDNYLPLKYAKEFLFNNNGGIINFISGNYYFSKAGYTKYKNVSFIGEGIRNTIFYLDNNNETFFVCSGGNEHYCYFDGFTIKGNFNNNISQGFRFDGVGRNYDMGSVKLLALDGKAIQFNGHHPYNSYWKKLRIVSCKSPSFYMDTLGPGFTINQLGINGYNDGTNMPQILIPNPSAGSLIITTINVGNGTGKLAKFNPMTQGKIKIDYINYESNTSPEFIIKCLRNIEIGNITISGDTHPQTSILITNLNGTVKLNNIQSGKNSTIKVTGATEDGFCQQIQRNLK